MASEYSFADAIKALSDRVDAVVSTVRQVVDERVQTWSSAFFKDYRDATLLVATKVDYISDAVLGGCDEDDSDSVSNLKLPKEHADLIDRLRVSHPAAYQVMLVGSQAVLSAPPLRARAVLADVVAEVEAAMLVA